MEKQAQLTWPEWCELEKKAYAEQPYDICNSSKITADTVMGSAGDNASDTGYELATQEWVDFAVTSITCCDHTEDTATFFNRNGVIV